jgi:phosphohistidine phosphatase
MKLLVFTAASTISKPPTSGEPVRTNFSAQAADTDTATTIHNHANDFNTIVLPHHSFAFEQRNIKTRLIALCSHPPDTRCNASVRFGVLSAMKKLVLLRHAVAEDRALGVRDAQRSLTARGRAKMLRAAPGLHALLPALELVLTSPLTRAVQTANILAEEYRPPVALIESEALKPGAEPQALLDVLHAHAYATTVMCVGHEPDLSRLASWLTTGGNKNLLTLKKGGACLLEFSREFRAGDARLVWLLTPRMLHGLRKR